MFAAALTVCACLVLLFLLHFCALTCRIAIPRRGVFEIAIRSGRPLYCSYTFGTSKCFSAWFDKQGLLSSISRSMRTR
jgi:hypothetical protein